MKKLIKSSLNGILTVITLLTQKMEFQKKNTKNSLPIVNKTMMELLITVKWLTVLKSLKTLGENNGYQKNVVLLNVQLIVNLALMVGIVSKSLKLLKLGSSLTMPMVMDTSILVITSNTITSSSSKTTVLMLTMMDLLMNVKSSNVS
jgi:hypothetical protein